MDFTAKNNFVVSNTDEKYFDKDLELFQKTFPNHKITPSLMKANQFNKKNLDGRMLLEMLVCVSPEEILSNRGIEKKDPPPPPPVEMTAEEATELLKENISKLDYNTQLKPMIKLLGVATEDNKKATFISALSEVRDQLVTADEEKKEVPAETGKIEESKEEKKDTTNETDAVDESKEEKKEVSAETDKVEESKEEKKDTPNETDAVDESKEEKKEMPAETDKVEETAADQVQATDKDKKKEEKGSNTQQ